MPYYAGRKSERDSEAHWRYRQALATKTPQALRIIQEALDSGDPERQDRAAWHIIWQYLGKPTQTTKLVGPGGGPLQVGMQPITLSDAQVEGLALLAQALLAAQARPAIEAQAEEVSGSG